MVQFVVNLFWLCVGITFALTVFLSFVGMFLFELPYLWHVKMVPLGSFELWFLVPWSPLKSHFDNCFCRVRRATPYTEMPTLTLLAYSLRFQGTFTPNTLFVVFLRFF